MRPPTPRPERVDAGVWPRMVAWLVDAGILGLIVALLFTLLPGESLGRLKTAWHALGETMGREMMTMATSGDDALSLTRAMLSPGSALARALGETHAAIYAWALPPILVFLGLALIYWPMLEAGSARATLGKRFLGLEVADARGRPLRIGQAIKRHLAGSLSWLTLNIGHLMAAHAPTHRALHDRLADTRVVWRADAPRRVPYWGHALVFLVMLLPIVWLMLAAASLSQTMQAAMGL